MKKKICIDCKIEKKINEFHKTKAASKDGHQNQCKQCKSDYQKHYHKNIKIKKVVIKNYKYGISPSDKNYQKDFQLRKVFGISLEEYNKMFNEQNGRCYICSKHQSELKKSLAVDHCHDTGKIRKLLCSKCNQGLGLFKDKSELLEKATNYLKMFDK